MNFHKLVLIGLLFQFFDFELGGFDIIPDFIEYLIVAYAFSKLDYRYAKAGLNSSLLLMVFAVIGIFYPALNDINALSIPLIITSTFISLLNIFYFACIFAVSNQIVQDASRKFPTVFLTGLILVNFSASLSMHLSLKSGSTIVLVTMAGFLFCYIYLFIFLWKRMAIEKTMREEKRSDLVDAEIELE